MASNDFIVQGSGVKHNTVTFKEGQIIPEKEAKELLASGFPEAYLVPVKNAGTESTGAHPNPKDKNPNAEKEEGIGSKVLKTITGKK